ncbi:acetyltransferase (GNAT) family protein [Roseimicrobium gellanilyticum]|uniref:Acetyltransferase (GNAT) family protein n=1 Tax=Roseimicrobium gellanilyticum TaxID=748857 RepID=A0A366HPQ1_9BACT|nr:GNAT family N-acetyltransferase [Roseimicrobium gellanilyticum]RBP44501.1 acetyltransferase (GNAT) family protein [Roseimicrobium gellanilyticum]
MHITDDDDITRDGIHFRRAGKEDASDLATMHRAAFRTALPHIPALHTPAEDLDFFTRMLAREAVATWLAVSSIAGEPMGFITFCPGAVEHLYVHPAHQGEGLGTALLRLAMRENIELKLWTFQRNTNARRFYEKHGFIADRMTDGMGNEEREPDMRYVWKQKSDARA